MRIRMTDSTIIAQSFLAEILRAQRKNPAPSKAEVLVEIYHEDEFVEVRRLIVKHVKMNRRARGRNSSRTYNIEGRLTYDVNRPGEDAGDNPQESPVRIKSYHPQSGGKVTFVD